MNDNNFKITLIKALEHKANTNAQFGTDDIWNIVMELPRCNLYIEETGLFTRREWNTYCSILHVQVPYDKQDLFIKKSSEIMTIAEQIYGRQGDNYLTDIDIGILVENYEVIDFTNISVTEIIGRSLADAELFMQQGKYDSAFDRVHTAFHGFLRKVLENKGVEFEESETLSQLYTKLHDKIASDINPPEMAELIKKTMRSSSGAIASINEMRNRYSLSHPNETIIGKREAEFSMKIVKDISDYINSVI